MPASSGLTSTLTDMKVLDAAVRNVTDSKLRRFLLRKRNNPFDTSLLEALSVGEIRAECRRLTRAHEGA